MKKLGVLVASVVIFLVAGGSPRAVRAAIITLTFDTNTGALGTPGAYTEQGMTVPTQDDSSLHYHIEEQALLNHKRGVTLEFTFSSGLPFSPTSFLIAAEDGSGPYTFTPFIDSNAGSVLSVPFGSNPVGTTIIFPTADWTQITSFKWKAPDAGIGSMSIDNLEFVTIPELTPIPEPASALLLATGFAAVNLASRRRRKGPRQNSNPRP